MTDQLERAKHSHPLKKPPTAHMKTGEKTHSSSSIKGKRDRAEPVAKSSESGGFGGLKRGFLFGSNARDTKTHVSKGCGNGGQGATVGDDVIRPKNQQNTKSSNLEFPEVQEAMKEAFPFLNTKSKH